MHGLDGGVEHPYKRACSGKFGGLNITRMWRALTPSELDKNAQDPLAMHGCGNLNKVYKPQTWSAAVYVAGWDSPFLVNAFVSNRYLCIAMGHCTFQSAITFGRDGTCYHYTIGWGISRGHTEELRSGVRKSSEARDCLLCSNGR